LIWRKPVAQRQFSVSARWHPPRRACRKAQVTLRGIKLMTGLHGKLIAGLGIALVALFLTACDGGRGYSRGIFHGLVIDKTEEEVTNKFGKPETVEKLGADGVRYVYRRKTFDPDNLNQIDEKTVIDFEMRAGKMIVVDVSFG
jgi:hypothetical protein